MDEERFPVGLMVEAILRQCDIDFIPYYIIQRGEYASGIILAKIDNLNGIISLRTQQRDFDTGQLVWVDALLEQPAEALQVDAFIQRSIARDPDLWVIEFESRTLTNPFEKPEAL